MGISYLARHRGDCHEPNGSRNDKESFFFASSLRHYIDMSSICSVSSRASICERGDLMLSAPPRRLPRLVPSLAMTQKMCLPKTKRFNLPLAVFSPSSLCSLCSLCPLYRLSLLCSLSRLSRLFVLSLYSLCPLFRLSRLSLNVHASPCAFSFSLAPHQQPNTSMNTPTREHKKKPNPYRIRLEEAATYSPT